MKLSSFTIFAVCLLITALPINKLTSQDEIYSGQIKGKILDETTLVTLPFSTIYITELEKGVSSDENGEFTIDEIPEGRYSLQISYIGYNEKTITEVRVNRNKTSYFDIKLTQNALSLDQVEITSFRYENLSSMPNSTFSLSREEIFRSPASNGNIFRAISTLPGVQSGGGSFAALAVRGQGTNDNSTFVDGFPVFDLSHLSGGANGFDDPNGGRFSIFGPRAVDGLVLQTGGFSALYGRRSSSYMELKIKEGNPVNPEFDALLSLTGASISYSGPINNKLSLYSSIRHQNFVPALTLTKQADLGFPSFTDVIVKLNSELNSKNKLTVLALFNPEKFKRTTENVIKDDNAKNKYENNFIADLNNSQGLLGIKVQTQTGDKSTWTNLAYGRFKSTDITFGIAYPQSVEAGSITDHTTIPYNGNKGLVDNTENEIGIRSIFTYQPNERATLKTGIDVSRIHIDHLREKNSLDTIYSFYRSSLPDNQRGQNYLLLSPSFYNSTYSGSAINSSLYTNLLYVLSSKLSTNIGLRIDHSDYSESATISPRFNLSYSLSEKSTLTFATGLYYQDPLNIYISDNNGKALQSERSFHLISGIKHYFNPDLKATVEGYYKSFDNLIVRPDPSVNTLENIGDGHAYGIDLSLIKRLSNKFNGQLSYSYSQSKRDNNDGLGEYDHLYSQPHIFNFLIGFQPNSEWIFSWKLRYSTGQPTNSSIVYENIFDDDNFLRYGQELIGKHDIRNDYFLGIDLRIDKRIQLKKFSINAFLDIQNVTNRENASARTFYEISGAYIPQALGILPTIGWRLEI